jgi:hypothetical protein
MRVMEKHQHLYRFGTPGRARLDRPATAMMWRPLSTGATDVVAGADGAIADAPRVPSGPAAIVRFHRSSSDAA